MNFEQHFLENTIGVFKNNRGLAEKSFAQLSNDKDFHYVPDAESNSIAVIIKHMSGNMISRWTDFLTSDGEKEWRNRDGEFDSHLHGNNKEELMKIWDKGWDCLLSHGDRLTWISLISFDDTWSVFGFRPKTEADKKKEAKPIVREIFNWVNPETKEVKLPDDLAAALKRNKKDFV